MKMKGLNDGILQTLWLGLKSDDRNRREITELETGKKIVMDANPCGGSMRYVNDFQRLENNRRD
jgi:hypothetical protein